MLDEKVNEEVLSLSNHTLVFLPVTRVRSHGYVQISFNVVKKDMDALGYKSESKHISINPQQQQTEPIESTYADNY